VTPGALSELPSHYLFADKFGRPAKGNDKDKVEEFAGYARRNFMVPVPCFATWDAFNAHLEAKCRERRERKLRGLARWCGTIPYEILCGVKGRMLLM
jgi:transposase